MIRHRLDIRNANFTTGIILTLNGEDFWADIEEVEAFAQKALEVAARARATQPSQG